VAGGRIAAYIHCSAIPPSLIASELFGHEKGAFTGALQRRPGRFEAADGGTIFLDETGDLPARRKSRCCVCSRSGSSNAWASNHPITVDVRVLAATNRDLEAAVASGAVRPELYYRLNVFPVRMPPLRERMDEIPLLVEDLVESFAKKAGKRIRHIETRTMQLLQAYDWPGNVRELQNVIERAVVLCDGDTFFIDESWLKRGADRRSEPAVRLATSLVEQEREWIEAALAESKGRVAGPWVAAARLGIPRQTLDSKIKALHIEKQRFRAP
jgi:formate hydrogenlyase transcriptional activator